MQSWLVLLYYAILAILVVFNYYVLTIRWWSAFNLALIITFLVIVVTAPEWTGETTQTADVIFLFLMVILAVLSPIFIFIYVVSQTLQDQIWKECYSVQD